MSTSAESHRVHMVSITHQSIRDTAQSREPFHSPCILAKGDPLLCSAVDGSASEAQVAMTGSTGEDG